MKILHIMNSLMPSGAETMLSTAKTIFSAHEMHILATYEDLGPYAEILRNSGYTIHHIYRKTRAEHHKEIISFIKENNFDVVHIHCEGESVLYAIDCKLAGVKRIIRTVHSLFQFNGLSRIRHHFFRWLMRAMGVKFVFISTDVEKNELERFNNKGITIENWCDPRFTYASASSKVAAVRELGLSQERFYIIVVGNCDQNKNHKLVFDCVARLSAVINIGMIHIGKGDEAEREYVKDIGIEERVVFCGFTDPMPWLVASKCFVCSSLREGFSISTLEALSIGLPCVLSNIDGLHFYREKGFEWIKYADLNTDSFCCAIKNVYDCGSFELEDQAKLANEMFGMETGARKYLRLYEGK